MSDQSPEPVEIVAEPSGSTGPDAVLASLDALDDAPVSDHVAVYEAAHEQLRRALDARPER